MICIHTGAKKQRVFFPPWDEPGSDAGMWCPAGRGAVVVRYGCRRFIYACATLNRNAKNVHAGINWESFLKEGGFSKKISDVKLLKYVIERSFLPKIVENPLCSFLAWEERAVLRDWKG